MEAGRLKKAFYQFIETVLSDMAEKGLLGEVFDRNIERRTQSTMFLDSFAARTTRPVVDFVHKRMKKIADSSRSTAKAENFPQPSQFHTWSPPPLPFSSSDETECKKHWRNKHKSMAPNAKDQAKPKSTCLIASSERDTRPRSFGHDSPVPDLSSNFRNKVIP